jgi:hypothetical protein
MFAFLCLLLPHGADSTAKYARDIDCNFFGPVPARMILDKVREHDFLAIDDWLVFKL